MNDGYTFALGQMQVRRSGYGAMQLAGPFAFGTPPDRAAAIGVLRAAVAAGVDHIDTAQYYGPGVVNVLLIPGTGSVAHLLENLAAEGVTLDDEALRDLDGVAA
jgi:aryl-alcohol dehydrogenase-like predicted oxidoreductase